MDEMDDKNTPSLLYSPTTWVKIDVTPPSMPPLIRADGVAIMNEAFGNEWLAYHAYGHIEQVAHYELASADEYNFSHCLRLYVTLMNWEDPFVKKNCSFCSPLSLDIYRVRKSSNRFGFSLS